MKIGSSSESLDCVYACFTSPSVIKIVFYMSSKTERRLDDLCTVRACVRILGTSPKPCNTERDFSYALGVRSSFIVLANLDSRILTRSASPNLKLQKHFTQRIHQLP